MLISPRAVFWVAAQTSVRTHARSSLLTPAPGPLGSAGTISSAGQPWRAESLELSGDDVNVCAETVLCAGRVLKQSVEVWASGPRLSGSRLRCLCEPPEPSVSLVKPFYLVLHEV